MTQALALDRILRSAGHEISCVLVGTSPYRSVPAYFTDGVSGPVVRFAAPTRVPGPDGTGMSAGATARDAGLRVTVHAGEAAGPESVWSAIRDLGAVRIGHAVRAVEDPALLDFMAERRIGVESSLTSNLQTSTVPSYEVHPLKTLLAHGILATLNTDDPTISGIDLRHEYEVAAPRAGLTREEIRSAQANAVEIAFLDEWRKDELRARARGR